MQKDGGDTALPNTPDIHMVHLRYEQLSSLDCWDELLDPPTTATGRFRANGNWQARLAAAAACRQMGMTVRVLPRRPCPLCIIGSPNNNKAYDILVA